MRKLILAGAAVMLGTAPVAIHAQTSPVELTEAQQAEYAAWSAPRKDAFATWPISYQRYFWSLTSVQQDAYWTLPLDRRAQIVAMSPAEQAKAWQAIEAQYTADAMAGTVEPIRFTRQGEMSQAAPVPPPAEYPICEEGVTDGCVNPREAGKDFGNVPLDHWPGKPASLMTPEEKVQHQ